jgi:hypothetical protein
MKLLNLLKNNLLHIGCPFQLASLLYENRQADVSATCGTLSFYKRVDVARAHCVNGNGQKHSRVVSKSKSKTSRRISLTNSVNKRRRLNGNESFFRIATGACASVSSSASNKLNACPMPTGPAMFAGNYVYNTIKIKSNANKKSTAQQTNVCLAKSSLRRSTKRGKQQQTKQQRRVALLQQHGIVNSTATIPHNIKSSQARPTDELVSNRLTIDSSKSPSCIYARNKSCNTRESASIIIVSST